MRPFIYEDGKESKGTFHSDALYNAINKGKEVHPDSKHAMVKLTDCLMVTHQEISFIAPNDDDVEGGFIRAVMCNMPEYDAVVWRIRPEIAFLSKKKEWYHDTQKKASHARIYLRLSLIKDGVQALYKGHNQAHNPS